MLLNISIDVYDIVNKIKIVNVDSNNNTLYGVHVLVLDLLHLGTLRKGTSRVVATKGVPHLACILICNVF